MSEQLCFISMCTTINIERLVFLTARSMTEMQLTFKQVSLPMRQQMCVRNRGRPH